MPSHSNKPLEDTLEFTPQESVYKFTDPIRLYKANDPYYWEVDNIPLKQLQENILWTKDQLAGLSSKPINIGRGNINELRPTADGTSMKVSVLPGKYTARVNDAFDITPLQFMTKLSGLVIGDIISYEILNAQGIAGLNLVLSDALEKIKSSVAGDAMNMNGLMERAFTYPVISENSSGTVLDLASGYPSTTGFEVKGPYPISEIIRWARENPNSANPDAQGIPILDLSDNSVGFSRLSRLESAFIKKWRGVSRTSVVDVPTELTIDVPVFDSSEFFWKDGSVTTTLPATQRIDLLFIYSKPVDVDSTTVGKYQNGVPSTITKAELGIVHGAGIGLDFASPEAIGEGDVQEPTTGITSEGKTKIMPHVADQNSITNGFVGLNVHGSFPAPDDLLNISPLLSEELETDALELVGQTILPVAYIVVKDTQTTISESEIIDIRPFFRTAELSYNERSGIAAAVPQLSLANPAVGQAELNQNINSLQTWVKGEVAKLTAEGSDEPGGGVENTSPQIVAGGIVHGGVYFGVESVLTHFEMEQGFATSLTEAWENIKLKYGLPINENIPFYPDWDLGRHTEDLDEAGLHPNDYICVSYNNSVDSRTFDYSSLKSKNAVDSFTSDPIPTISQFNTNDRIGSTGVKYDYTLHGRSMVYFSKKTILLDMTQVSWMGQYDVFVELWNCVPQSSPPNHGDKSASTAFGHTNGVWVEKGPDRFTIYTAWAADDPAGNNATQNKIFHVSDPRVQRDGEFFSGFSVITSDFVNHPYNFLPPTTKGVEYIGEPRRGACSLPTVTFKVVGYPSNYSGYYAGQVGNNGLTDMSQDNPTVVLF